MSDTEIPPPPKTAIWIVNVALLPDGRLVSEIMDMTDESKPRPETLTSPPLPFLAKFRNEKVDDFFQRIGERMCAMAQVDLEGLKKG